MRLPPSPATFSSDGYRWAMRSGLWSREWLDFGRVDGRADFRRPARRARPWASRRPPPLPLDGVIGRGAVALARFRGASRRAAGAGAISGYWSAGSRLVVGRERPAVLAPWRWLVRGGRLDGPALGHTAQYLPVQPRSPHLVRAARSAACSPTARRAARRTAAVRAPRSGRAARSSTTLTLRGEHARRSGAGWPARPRGCPRRPPARPWAPSTRSRRPTASRSPRRPPACWRRRSGAGAARLRSPAPAASCCTRWGSWRRPGSTVLPSASIFSSRPKAGPTEASDSAACSSETPRPDQDRDRARRVVGDVGARLRDIERDPARRRLDVAASPIQADNLQRGHRHVQLRPGEAARRAA